MNRIVINVNFLIFNLLAVILHAQPAAEISYITSKGSVYLMAQPKIQITKGQKLEQIDTIVLKDSAGIRIFFPNLQCSQKYYAPDTIFISREIELLKNRSGQTGWLKKLNAEITQLIHQYLKPEYSRYAGTRGAQIRKNIKIHDHILSFRQHPKLVLWAVSQPQILRIYTSMNDQKSTLLTEIPVAEGHGVVTVPIKEVILNYNTTYFWDVSGETQSGTIKLVSVENAEKIEKTICELKTDAIEEIEAAELIATYLLNQGFWAEAYCYLQEGIAVDPGNPVLKNLQLTILTLRPEDSAFQVTIQEKADLTLRYSFHVKKENHLQEIYSGSTVHSGDMLQIRLETSDDCYLFILNVDAGKNIYVLYPLKQQDHFLKGGKQIVVPEIGKYFKADNRTGEEKLLLIASKVPLDYLGVELDKYFTTPISQSDGFNATRGLMELRGSGTIIDKDGEAVHDITNGLENFKLSRLLQGQGLVVKEIVFEHIN